MPRIARTTCRVIDSYPFYEWVENFVWEDDEFQEVKRGQFDEQCSPNMEYVAANDQNTFQFDVVG